MCYLKAVSKSAKISPEAERIIKELKSGELEVRDVPEEFALDSKSFLINMIFHKHLLQPIGSEKKK